MELPHDPAILLLGIYPDKTIIQKIYTPMFIAALFTIAKTLEQPKCPLTIEWIQKIWGCVCVYIYTHKHIHIHIYMHIYTYTYIYIHTNTHNGLLLSYKKNEIMSCAVI